MANVMDEERGPRSPEEDRPGSPSEGHILAAIDSRDYRQATTLIMAAYGKIIYDYCSRFVGDKALADDVHQTVFIEVFKDLEKFSRKSDVRAWVFGIATHRCLDGLKSTRRSQRRFVDEAPDVPDGRPGADERLHRRVQEQALEGCLAALPPHMRSVLLLRREGFSYDAMSRSLRKKAGALRVRAMRALALVRECLSRKGVLQ